LAHADLRGAHLGAADLEDADLDYADLRGASFESAEVPAYLAGASFAHARLSGHTAPGGPNEARTRQQEQPPRSPKPPGDARPSRIVKVFNGDTIELAHLGWSRLIGVHVPDTSYDAHAPARDRIGVRARTLVTRMTRADDKVLVAPANPIREDKPGN